MTPTSHTAGEPKHTPLPWRADPSGLEVVDADGETILTSTAPIKRSCLAAVARTVRAVNSFEALREACQAAVAAAEHVVRVCEDDLRVGSSPNPFERSHPNAVIAECYGAMAFVTKARAALAASEEARP